jgi:hypothetical protein
MKAGASTLPTRHQLVGFVADCALNLFRLMADYDVDGFGSEACGRA